MRTPGGRAAGTASAKALRQGAFLQFQRTASTPVWLEWVNKKKE